MAVVTSDFLAGVLTSFRALFQRDFDAASALQGWNDIAIPMPSDTEGNTYEWFGTVPKMEDVTHDTPSINDLPEYNFSILNKEYQAVIEVQRAAMERDRLGLIAPRISQLSEEAARHPGELMFSLFETNPTTFDGTAFFANSHNVSTFDNLLAGTGITVAQFQADLASARAAMRLFKDDRGRVMNIIGNVIVIPPALEMTVWIALNTGNNQNAGNNIAPPSTLNNVWQSNGYTVIVNPFLTDATDWYLLTSMGPTRRPFIYQVEKAPMLESDTNPTTRVAIIERTFLYSVYGRYNVGFTDPRFGVKVVNS